VAGEPYVGPRPFAHGDREIFFGRDAEIAEIVSLVIARRSVLLYAVSGAGKSSLLRAGVDVALVDQGFEVLGPARFQSPVAPPADARNAFSFAMLRELRVALDLHEEEGVDAAMSIGDFLAALPRGVDTYGFPSPRVLVIDQFEEIFTLYPDHWEERSGFLREVADALDRDSQLRILIAVREEYIAQLEQYADLLPGLLRARFHLERLRAPAALVAVTEPLAPRGIDFAPGVAETLVHDLCETRVDVGKGTPLRIEGEFVEPVQLQVVCRTLWLRLGQSVRRITASDLAALGNVDDSLAHYYDDAIAAAAGKASVREYELRVAFERSMITSAGTRATVFAGDRETAPLPRAALDELARHHLIRAEWRAGARWYELTHDRLIEPIRHANRSVIERHQSRRGRRIVVGGAAFTIVLVLAVLGVSSIWFSKQTVPNVVGKSSVFEAGQKLTGDGLTLSGDARQRVDATVRPGTVVGQTPVSGQRVKLGTPVALLVGIGAGRVAVPSVVGGTLARADAVLRAAHVSLGQASPAPARSKSVVVSQIPAAGRIVKEGTPVAVFLFTPRRESGAGVVPAVKGDTAATVATEAASRGLVPKVVPAFSTVKAGAVIRTQPPSGTRLKAGQTLQIVVSVGSPELAFDDGKDVRLINGASGKRLRTIAKSSQTETDPTFSADGTKVAFVRRHRVFLADQAELDDPAVPLTRQGQKYGDLAWAPTVDVNLLAMLRDESDNHSNQDLCLGRVTGDGVTPRCIVEQNVNLVKVVRWAPDGKSIFALGVKKLGRFGIVRYESKKAFSPDPRDWGNGEFVTDTSKRRKGVIDMAISPDGKRAAFVANFDSDAFQLYLGQPTDFMLAAANPQGLRACKVAWRSDGKELVVVQADEVCSEDIGELVRVPVNNTDGQTLLGLSGDNPVFQPLRLG
jgi:beta-lactam-binding protein with PASTA domain/Tol biopolymer transport system component